MSRDRRKGEQPFTEDERDYLFIEGRRILSMIRQHRDEGWTQFALVQPTHTAEEWKGFFDREVRPKIEKVNRLSGARDQSFRESENAFEGLKSQSHAGSSAADATNKLETKVSKLGRFVNPREHQI